MKSRPGTDPPTNPATRIAAPPRQLDGADVLYWAFSAAEPFFVVPGTVEQGVPIHGVAVCRYPGRNSFHRVSCDVCWRVVSNADHSTAREALQAWAMQFDTTPCDWRAELIGAATWFGDEAQRRRAQDVVVDRLADEHDQEECRTLARLAWQFAMTYEEVTEERLAATLRPSKRAAFEALRAAAVRGPEAVDAWIAECEQTWPLIAARAPLGG